MTDEEALETLTSKEVVNPYLTLEALEIAIEALRERTERKTGRWIEEHWYSKCSVCGSKQLTATTYCPDCGAKMEEQE